MGDSYLGGLLGRFVSHGKEKVRNLICGWIWVALAEPKRDFGLTQPETRCSSCQWSVSLLLRKHTTTPRTTGLRYGQQTIQGTPSSKGHMVVRRREERQYLGTSLHRSQSKSAHLCTPWSSSSSAATTTVAASPSSKSHVQANLRFPAQVLRGYSA